MPGAEKCKIEGAQNGSQLVLATEKPGEGRRGKRELEQGWCVVSGLVGPWAKRALRGSTHLWEASGFSTDGMQTAGRGGEKGELRHM